MASLDKLVKSLEALKLTLSTTSNEHVRHKDRETLCQIITECLCSSEMRSAPNFPNLLSYSIETLLQMCDDKDSNIRMMSDECLNRIIRANMSTMHNTILKIHVELHKEIKKNGKARSLRAALSRFAQLAHTIKPQRGKAYIQTLNPCLIAIARRQEESVLETLATSVPKIFSALGSFASDSQIKSLLETLLDNVVSDNAVVRRTSATCITHICLSIPKSQIFLAFVLSTLLDLVVPLREETNSSTILGVLNCVRSLLPHINYQERQSVIRGSFGTKRKHTSHASPPIDYLIQIFELCLEWSGSSDHNVVATSLETLHQALTSAPSALINQLKSPQGLVRSRIHPHQHVQQSRLHKRSLSEMSLASSVGGDDSLLFELDEAPLVNLSKWLSEQQVDKMPVSRSSSTDQPQIPSRPSSTTPSTSTLSLDSSSHDHNIPSIVEENIGENGGGLTRPWREEEKPLSPEPPDLVVTDSISPPGSPGSLQPLQNKEWDIGELFDGESSSTVFAARFLVTRFLLGGGSVRVLVRCLAVSCLTQLVRLQPSVFFVALDKNLSSDKSEGIDRVSDVLQLSDHQDPQLRGLIRVLAGQLMSSSLCLSTEPSDEVISIIPKIVQLLLQGVGDESSVCVRHSLSSISLFLKNLLESDFHSAALPLLDILDKTVLNPYWLVKVKLVEVVSELPFTTIAYTTGDTGYQNKVINSILLPSLGDSDSRVRKAVAATFLKLLENLYYPSDHAEGDLSIALGSNIIEKILLADPNRTNYITGYKIRNNLSRIVFLLTRTMVETSSKYTVYGCVETLCLLSTNYEVTDYPSSWQCSVNPSSTSNSICSGGLLSMAATLLTSSNLSIDLECHTSLLTLSGNLFYGLSQSFLRYADTVFDPSSLWPNIKDPKVCEDGKVLLQHVLRILNMLVRMMDDSPKATGVSPLKRRTSRAQSPPSKNPQSPFLDKEKKEEKNRAVGHFLNVPHCLKLYDLIKSAYNNYRVTLEEGSSEKFLKLVTAVMKCLCDLLKPATITSSCALTEEILSDLKIVFVLDTTHTVQVVNQLLKCIFVRKTVTKEAMMETKMNQLEPGIFDTLFGKPLIHLASLIETNHQIVQVNKESETTESKQQSAAVTLDRNALAIHIKLFESIVIQALKEYTVTSNVQLQVEVLKLLMQLVHFKVNYCLLDPEQIFLQFVLKQFDLLEAGQIRNAELLIPEVFQFLPLLSNEKNHSKPVINIPQVMRLCEGLMASGQDPLTHCIPALTPLVEHVFLSPPPGCDAKELETQCEVILDVLLKLVEYPQVITLLKNVMKCSGDQWKTLYTKTIDALVKGMSFASIRLDRVHTMLSLLNSGPSPPLPHLLTLLFTPQAEGQCADEWLGGVVVVLMSICNSKEELVFLQLDQMDLYIQEEGDDPLNVNTKSKQVQPQQLMAKLILKVIKNMSVEMELIECLNSQSCANPELLYTHFADFIYTVIHMIGPGNFEEVSKCLIQVLKTSREVEDITRSFLSIHKRNPLPLLLWAYLLALTDVGSRELWKKIIRGKWENLPSTGLVRGSSVNTVKKKRCINSEFVRRTSIILYCEYVCLLDIEEKSSDLDWFLESHIYDIITNCYEPPVDKMLRTIYLSQSLSKLLLDQLSRCIVLNQAGFTYQLLHCLEFINPAYSGQVLKLVALSLIQHSNISIARLAVSFCSRTIEYLLTLEPDQVSEQMSKDQIIALMDLFSTNSKLSKRGSVVISLLNKLGNQMYGISAQDVMNTSAKSIDTAEVQVTKVDSTWLASLVKEKCCHSDDIEAKQCASLLNKLSKEEICEILNTESFNLVILQHCFHPSSVSPSEKDLSEAKESETLPHLHQTARELLLHKLTKLNKKPTDLLKIESLLMTLVPAVTNYLSSVSDNNTKHDVQVFPSNSQHLFCNFALLVVKIIDRSLSDRVNSKLLYCSTKIGNLLECLSVILNFPSVTGLLEYEDISYICTILFSVIKSLTRLDVPMKTLKSATDDNGSEKDEQFAATCLKMASLTSWLETSPFSSKLIPSAVYSSLREIILRLSVSSKVLYYCRVPVEAWPLPLKCGSVPPPIDINLLHDVTVLRQLTNRISMLRWRARQEFEETWVCLLSALIPSIDAASLEQEDLFNIMQLNSLVVDAVSWLVLTTLRLNTSKSDRQCYLHVPRLSPNSIYSLSRWSRLKELNDLMLSKFKIITHKLPLNLTRVDQRPNIERFDDTSYGIGQLSVEYLQYQILIPEDRPDPPKTEIHMLYLEREKKLVESGIDVRSCVQFLLDLFSQWVVSNSGLSDSLDLCVIRSTLCLSDLFSEKAHYSWMLDRFLLMSRNHPQFDHVIHEYLTIGVCKSAAVLAIQDEDQCEKVLKVLECALKSGLPPVRTAGVQGLLYLLQAIQPPQVTGETNMTNANPDGSSDASLLSHLQIQGGSPLDYTNKIIAFAIEHINKHFITTLESEEEDCLAVVALVMYVTERFPNSGYDLMSLIKSLTQLIKSPPSHRLYQASVQGVERLLLVLRSADLCDPFSRLALERLSHSDPLVTLPALQLLLASIYSDVNKNDDSTPDNMSWTMEKMETTSILFDRIKKGYLIEVELIVEVVAKVLSDLFPASEILTKVIGEFLSPNQPHKRHMARIVLQCFSQACDEDQLSLLQDWVVHFLNNFSSNLPTAAWCLCCFFISASTNPNLKAIFPLVQSRITQCDIEDRKILCIAALDFYRQLSTEQQEAFHSTIKETAQNQKGPFTDIIACL